jgi:hypothetical protein
MKVTDESEKNHFDYLDEVAQSSGSESSDRARAGNEKKFNNRRGRAHKTKEENAKQISIMTEYVNEIRKQVSLPTPLVLARKFVSRGLCVRELNIFLGAVDIYTHTP